MRRRRAEKQQSAPKEERKGYDQRGQSPQERLCRVPHALQRTDFSWHVRSDIRAHRERTGCQEGSTQLGGTWPRGGDNEDEPPIIAPA